MKPLITHPTRSNKLGLTLGALALMALPLVSMAQSTAP